MSLGNVNVTTAVPSRPRKARFVSRTKNGKKPKCSKDIMKGYKYKAPTNKKNPRKEKIVDTVLVNGLNIKLVYKRRNKHV